jgi:hypothetical protein
MHVNPTVTVPVSPVQRSMAERPLEPELVGLFDEEAREGMGLTLGSSETRLPSLRTVRVPGCPS